MKGDKKEHESVIFYHLENSQNRKGGLYNRMCNSYDTISFYCSDVRKLLFIVSLYIVPSNMVENFCGGLSSNREIKMQS